MKRVLIIEDEKDILDMATMILEDEGYEVSGISEFQGFEGKINASNADLVLLDLNLKGYHGKEICKYIKRSKHLSQTSVVLMSANRDIQTVKEEAGADACISKPFDLYHFIDTIRTYINKAEPVIQTI